MIERVRRAGPVRIGTAGWTIPKRWDPEFSAEGSHLERYARRFGCVEINSSFYRSHRIATWERWGKSVSEEFRFSVKAPKGITHEARLDRCGAMLQQFFDEVSALGERLGPVLFQMPPKLAFDEELVRDFLGTLREIHGGPVAMEPRHASWFTAGAGALLREFAVARVAADPVPAAVAQSAASAGVARAPGGWNGLVYRRMHGSPRVYYSGYTIEFLGAVAEAVRRERAQGAEVWCVFDNTALGEAAGDALHLERLLNAG